MQRLIKGVADHDLSWPRVRHEARAHIQRVTNKTDMRAREESQQQKTEFAHRQADMKAVLFLHSIDTPFPNAQSCASAYGDIH